MTISQVYMNQYRLSSTVAVIICDESRHVALIYNNPAEVLSFNKIHWSCSYVILMWKFGQVANALQFIHEKGIAHLDVKPDNIYVKNSVYKLGDFGCATLIDNSLPIEEGDARYMPQEVLNENYDHLDKVDIFSLGASIYELIRRLPLPESGSHFLNLKEGKLPLLPGHSLQFQNLLKVLYIVYLPEIWWGLCFILRIAKIFSVIYCFFTLSSNMFPCLSNVLLHAAVCMTKSPECGL